MRRNKLHRYGYVRTSEVDGYTVNPATGCGCAGVAMLVGAAVNIVLTTLIVWACGKYVLGVW